MTFEPIPEEPIWARLLKIAVAIGLVALAGFAVVAGASYLGRQVGNAVGPDEVGDAPQQVEPGLPVTVEIPLGSSGQDIGALLASNGVVHSALEFEVAVRNVDGAQRLQAGTYELTTLMDPAEVVAVIISGPAPAVYRVTIIEGRTVEEILVSLGENTSHDFSDFEEALLGGLVSTSLREIPEDATLGDWEGLLFPDTYEFSDSAEPAAILQRLGSTMETRVRSIDWSAWKALGYTEYEGITLASLIEKEAKIEEDRPKISSVIYNRLANEWPLDIDATVFYALGTNDPTQFDRDLDSPYNTYLVQGLPPTPIASPGKASLEAAAAPADTPFFFYVLSDDPVTGAHSFAETLEQHNANVAKAREDGVLP